MTDVSSSSGWLIVQVAAQCQLGAYGPMNGVRVDDARQGKGLPCASCAEVIVEYLAADLHRVLSLPRRMRTCSHTSSASIVAGLFPMRSITSRARRGRGRAHGDRLAFMAGWACAEVDFWQEVRRCEV